MTNSALFQSAKKKFKKICLQTEILFSLFGNKKNKNTMKAKLLKQILNRLNDYDDVFIA